MKQLQSEKNHQNNYSGLFVAIFLLLGVGLCEAAYYDPTLPPQLSTLSAANVPFIKPKPKPIDYNAIMKLTMVVNLGKQHYCVINDGAYSEGDHVGIYVIRQILSDRVVLMNGSEKLWLCLVTDKASNRCY